MTLILDDTLSGQVGSPQWWVDRLYWRLRQRLQVINVYDDYYQGNFPLPWLAPQAAEDFRRILKMSRANYMGLVCDAMVERMAVEGFRINPEQPDDPQERLKVNTKKDPVGITDQATWDIWQYNSLDTVFDQGLLEGAITGQSYLMVAPNMKDERYPYVTVEHASQVIIAFKPGTNRREAVAALKVWMDDWTGVVSATLYLPGLLFKYSAIGTQMKTLPAAAGPMFEGAEIPVWGPRGAYSDVDPESTGLDVVPIFELPNNPRLLFGGISELHDLMDSQDRIVKTIADRLMTQDYGAFPQKWATGWPETDAAGNPNPPIEVGRDRMLTTEVMEAKLGQFSAADLGGYLDSKQQDIKDIASRSRTPAQYLLGEMNNVNGDTLKASESGLVAKVRQRFRGINDPLEDAMRLARKMARISTPADRNMETVWRNPEFRTEGELVDALVKMQTIGVPEEALWERWGATPTEITRWKAMLDDKMARAAAGDATVVLADRYRQAAAPIAPTIPGRPGGGQQRPATGTGSGSDANRPVSQRKANAAPAAT